MSERVQRLVSRLQESRQLLDGVLDQVGDRWEEPVYSDGLGWTVRQLVNHLADADRGHNFQVMNIAEGNDVIPEDFDIERYNKSVTAKRAEKSAEEARSELDETRKQLTEWLFALDPAKLDRTGRHASLQILSVEQIITVLSEHERGHAQDIAGALGLSV